MHSFFIFIIAVNLNGIATNDIKSKITQYFSSETTKSFKRDWSKVQKSLEFTTTFALGEGFGEKSMNVYINRFQSPLALSAGYYHSDNQVQMVFLNMGLEELPHLGDLDVSIPLHDNVLSLDVSVSKMIVHTSYVIFRKHDDIIYSLLEQNPYKSSPFRFQQVKNAGDLAISIEGCSLAGVILAKVVDGNIRLGHHQFRLTECQFTIEIYTLGRGAPPVIANYLPKGAGGLDIEYLAIRPLIDELVPKLQATMYSYVNMSLLIPNGLSKFEEKQESLMDDTKNFIDQTLRDMNKKTTEGNMGVMDLEDFTLGWEEQFDTAVSNATEVKMTKMTIMGLDTLYSSYTGGPYRLSSTEIMEELRFSALKVTGHISVTGFQDDNEFAVEVYDLAVDMTMSSNLAANFQVTGWRYQEFSCPKMEFLPIESLTVGYLLKVLPQRISAYLKSIYTPGSTQLNEEADSQVPAVNPVNVGEEENKPNEQYGQQNLNAEIESAIDEQGAVQLNQEEPDAAIARNNRETVNKSSQQPPKKKVQISKKKAKLVLKATPKLKLLRMSENEVN